LLTLPKPRMRLKEVPMSRRAMRASVSEEQRWAEIDAQVAPLFEYWVDVILSGHDTKDRKS
jgi:hypothetical protein